MFRTTILSIIAGLSVVTTCAFADVMEKRVSSVGPWAINEIYDTSAGKYGCAMVTGTPSSRFALVVWENRERLSIYLSSPKWNYRARYDKLVLDLGTNFITVPEAMYDGSEIFQITDQAQSSIKSYQGVSRLKKDISVLDYKGRMIWRIPGKSMGSAFDRMLRCSDRL